MRPDRAEPHAPALPDMARLFTALEATWPPAGGELAGPFRLRHGASADWRNSAAVWSEAAGPPDQARVRHDLPRAEARMRDAGQLPCVMVRGPVEAALDDALVARGYLKRGDGVLLAGPVAPLATQVPPLLTAILASPRLALCQALLTAAGVGAGAVLERLPPPRRAVLGRRGDRPAGIALIAVDGPVAVVPVLYVLPDARRHGVARAMLQRAAGWAEGCGCTVMIAAVDAFDEAARVLLEGLGLAPASHFHYRVCPAPGA